MKRALMSRKSLKRCSWALICATAMLTFLGTPGAKVKPVLHSSMKVVPNAGQPDWGTSNTPFAASSPWNSRPVKPELGSTLIPSSKFAPAIEAGQWSTGVFISKPSDRPVMVRGHRGMQGLWNVDDQIFSDVTIPRWPSGVRPALKSDGHADIVDAAEGIVHSFWQLRNEDGLWTAAQYAWTSLKGRGWGDPAHYFQGARAAGVPAMGGLIRKHEVEDKLPLYKHALAMSLTTSALSPSPSYVFPATSADTGASRNNSGNIPQGALMMLPASFDRNRLSDRRVRKIAETLMVYGAYVVDRNEGTPFIIYAEIGSGLNLHERFWNRDAIADLERIRLQLRQVIGAEGWLDGNGRRYVPQKNLNLLSMRGPWTGEQGATPGTFESWSQSVIFSQTSRRMVQKRSLPSSITDVAWAAPVVGESYRLTCLARGGAKLRLILSDAASGKAVIDSGELSNGESYAFSWPQQDISASLYAISGIEVASSVRGDLRRLVPGVRHSKLRSRNSGERSTK